MCVIAFDSRRALQGYISARDSNDPRILFPTIFTNERVYMDTGLMIH